jgi:tetratricopeptide (TPR) repeat protein
MGTQTHRFKCIVTALWLLVGFSVPATAQDISLDELYQQLAQSDAENYTLIEQQIVTAWGKSGSPAMDLLMRRGDDAMEEGAFDAAVDHFSALVDHAPGFSEGYYGRASAYYFLGKAGPALEDLRQVLAMNPRHFEAMRGLAIIMEELGRPDDALEIYQMILAIHPQSGPANEGTTRLKLQLEGQSL